MSFDQDPGESVTISGADFAMMRDELKTKASECERMRDLLDRRPAINVGLVDAYVKWTRLVYVSDMAVKPQHVQEH